VHNYWGKLGRADILQMIFKMRRHSSSQKNLNELPFPCQLPSLSAMIEDRHGGEGVEGVSFPTTRGESTL
jgi:hypothetical protein